MRVVPRHLTPMHVSCTQAHSTLYRKFPSVQTSAAAAPHPSPLNTTCEHVTYRLNKSCRSARIHHPFDDESAAAATTDDAASPFHAAAHFPVPAAAAAAAACCSIWLKNSWKRIPTRAVTCMNFSQHLETHCGAGMWDCGMGCLVRNRCRCKLSRGAWAPPGAAWCAWHLGVLGLPMLRA